MYVLRWNIIIILWTTSLFLADSCPDNSYILKDGFICYWVTSSIQSANHSSRSCQRNNGLLAIIPNQQINDELRAWELFEGETLWIGVNDKENEGVFKNYDGSPISWTNWAPGQPNDPNISSLGPQDCVYIDGEGKWYDDGCFTFKKGLCFTALEPTSRTQTISVSSPKAVTTTSRQRTTAASVSRLSTRAAMLNGTSTSTQNRSQTTEVTICTSAKKTEGSMPSNIVELMIPAGIVGIIIGTVGTIVVIHSWKRCRMSKQQSHDKESKYESLDVNRSTLGPQYDVIGTANPVTSGLDTQTRRSEDVYVNTNV